MISHVLDVYLIKIGDMPILTMNMVTMIVAAVVTVLVMMLAAKAIQTGPESEGNDRYLTRVALGQLVEAIVVYLRDEMLVPVMGAKATKRYLPCLLTLFFFILINNLLGMIPLLDIQHLLGIHGRRWWHGHRQSEHHGGPGNHLVFYHHRACHQGPGMEGIP